MRILVTGVTGFAGSWLAETLLARGGCQVAGLARSRDWPPPCSHLAERVRLFPCDLADSHAVEDVLRSFEPEQVYHLAGFPHVGRSFKDPDAAWRGNLAATRSLYEAIQRWGGKPRVLYVSTGHVYGDPDRVDEELHEDRSLRPTSPYAASKAAADLLSYQVSRSDGLDVVRVRPFNHFGPRQSAEFAVGSFARQLAEVKVARRPPVLVTGDLSAERDLTDVRDVVAAYVLLMEQGRAGEVYNLASGTHVVIREVLDRLVALAGVPVELRQRDDLRRPTEPPRSRVNTDRLRAATGWRPRIALDETLRDTLEYWSRLA
jgi:GDP-4-dehydro-6-deoxy-D-mannose reductase